MGGVGVTGCPRTGAHGYGQGVCSCPQVCRAGRVPVAGVTCEDTQGAAAVQGCGKTLEHGGEPDRSTCLCTRVQQEGFSTKRCTEKEQLAADVGKGPFLLFGTTTRGGAAHWLPPTMYPGPTASSDAVLSAQCSIIGHNKVMVGHQLGVSCAQLLACIPIRRAFPNAAYTSCHIATARGNGPTKAPCACSSSHPLIPHRASV